MFFFVRNIKYFLIAGALLLVGLLIYGFTNQSSNKYTVNLSSQTVIKQMESLNRIETASYTIEKIIDVQTPGTRLQQLLLGDRILLIAQGQVIAGFDLAKVREEDIQVEDSTLKMKLPAPEILVTRLDNEQTRVYDRDQGLLSRGEQDLESEARKEAEVVIRDAACKGGILQEASKNARNQMTTQFKSLGFTSVVIDIPEGTCS
jgi:tRNA U55 pseudouridine synthase TruB